MSDSLLCPLKPFSDEECSFSTKIYVSETMKYIVRILQFSIYKNANIFLNLIVADKGLKGTVVNQTCH